MLTVFLLLQVVAVAHLAIHAGAARLIGFRTAQLQLGTGRAVLGTTVRGVRCNLGWLPLGCTAKLDVASHASASPLRRAALPLVGLVLLWTLGVVVCGGADRAAAIVGAMAGGTVSPSQGAAAFRAFCDDASASPLATLGAVFVANAATSSLPVRFSNVGDMIAQLTDVAPSGEPPAWHTWFGLVSVLLQLALYADWGWIVCRAILA